MSALLLPYGTAAAVTTHSAAPAAARPHTTPSEISIVSGGHKVTAAGATWYLSMTVTLVDTTAFTSVSLTRGSATSAKFEEHSWYIQPPASSLVSTGAGHYTFHPSSTATSPLMAINLKFAETTSKPLSCTSGSETQYQGTLSGTFELSTGFSKLPKIGSATSTSFSFPSPNTLLVDYSCIPPTPKPPTCHKGDLWAVAGAKAPFGNGDGFTAGSTDSIFMSDQIAFSKPTGAFRHDTVQASEPASSIANSILKFTTSGGLLTGSGTLDYKGITPVAYGPFTCLVSGVKHTETTKAYNNAPFTDNKVEAHPLLGPLLSFNVTHGTVGITTVS